MIAAHPAVACFPDTHFFYKLRLDRRRANPWALADGRTHWKFCQFLDRTGHPELANKLPRFRPFLRQYVRAFVTVLDQLADQQGKQHWLESTDDHLMYIDLIESFIPDALFIHVIHNGRDVIPPLYTACQADPERFELGDPEGLKNTHWLAQHCAFRWNEAVHQTRGYAVCANHFVIRFDRFIEATEVVLADLYRFLDIPFNHNMVAATTQRSASVSAAVSSSAPSRVQGSSPNTYDGLFDSRQKEFVEAYLDDLEEMFLPHWLSPGQARPEDLAVGADATRADQRRVLRPSILFIGSWLPKEQPDTGGEQRLALIIGSLRRIGRVTFCLAMPWGTKGKTFYYDETITQAKADTAAAHCWNLRRHRTPPEWADRVARFHPSEYDVVFLHRLSASWWTAWTGARHTIVDMDDIPSQKFLPNTNGGHRLVRILKWLRYQRIRWSQRRMLDMFRYLLVCSEEDKRYLADHPHVSVVPNSYWPRPEMDQPADKDESGSLLFVGSLTYWPNVDGMNWFVRQVLPLIRRQDPAATVTVVGLMPPEAVQGPNWSWREEPGVHFVGTVDTVAPYILEAKVEVCPILEGGGTRIKIIESLAFGKPVVTTSLGAYGIYASEAEGIYRRDDPEEFAQACVELLQNRQMRKQTGDAGRRFVKKNYGPASIEERLGALIDTIVQERSPERKA